MSTGYCLANEVREIGEELIRSHHELHHLEGQKIVYIFRDKTKKAAGKETFGTASVKQGLNALLCGEKLTSDIFDDGSEHSFFLIDISFDIWQQLVQKERLALIFHELMHCYLDDEGRKRTQTHDFENFVSEVAEFGAWTPSLTDLKSVMLGRQSLEEDNVRN